MKVFLSRPTQANFHLALYLKAHLWTTAGHWVTHGHVLWPDFYTYASLSVGLWAVQGEGCTASHTFLSTAWVQKVVASRYLWNEYMSKYKNATYHKGNIQHLSGDRSAGVQLNFPESRLIINRVQESTLRHCKSRNQRKKHIWAH